MYTSLHPPLCSPCTPTLGRSARAQWVPRNRHTDRDLYAWWSSSHHRRASCHLWNTCHYHTPSGTDGERLKPPPCPIYTLDLYSPWTSSLLLFFSLSLFKQQD